MAGLVPFNRRKNDVLSTGFDDFQNMRAGHLGEILRETHSKLMYRIKIKSTS